VAGVSLPAAWTALSRLEILANFMATPEFGDTARGLTAEGEPSTLTAAGNVGPSTQLSSSVRSVPIAIRQAPHTRPPWSPWRWLAGDLRGRLLVDRQTWSPARRRVGAGLRKDLPLEGDPRLQVQPSFCPRWPRIHCANRGSTMWRSPFSLSAITPFAVSASTALTVLPPRAL
jgi:hypothetical protein